MRLRACARRATLLALWALAGGASAAEISGRVVHPAREEAARGVEVHALGIDVTQQTVLRSTRTDAAGAFHFADLPSPAAYLLRAMYDGLAFPGPPVLFREGEPEASSGIEIRIYERARDGSRLQLTRAQWVVEHEAGVYRVQQSARIANPGAEVITAGAQDPPLLRVGLAPSHGEVSTSFGPLPPGVTLVGGVAEIRGPVFPGEDGFDLELQYELETPDGELRTELRFPDPVAELTLYVEDFGVRIDAGELHPARPARESDIFYQRFLGFDLTAGARLPLQITPLPAVAPTPPWLATLLAAALVGALVFFVGQPITASARAPAGEAAGPSAARAQLEAALADLDHDFETGKLSEADRDRLRADLRREALQALARERRAAADGAAPAPAARRCACGKPVAPSDRFCSHCGKAL